MKTSKIFAYLIVGSFVLGLGFQNCSRANFAALSDFSDGGTMELGSLTADDSADNASESGSGVGSISAENQAQAALKRKQKALLLSL